MKFEDIVSPEYDLHSEAFMRQSKHILDLEGVLVLKDFITPKAIVSIKEDGKAGMGAAYFCVSNHNVYLEPFDENFEADHPRNREVVSSKGLIGDDQIPNSSALKTLYNHDSFRDFISHVVGEDALYPYADSLSAVNIHYANEGQELGWHFDNSTFAVTMLIEKPEAGGDFEYVKDMRDAESNELNFDAVRDLLDGMVETSVLTINPGSLVLFRGKNSIHRVSPVIGNKTRMMAVLAYNTKPGVQLSESARMTFYGRLQ
ncbi:MAG: 2OG-Fe(II) oxygenase [Pseudomonadota bacterium]